MYWLLPQLPFYWSSAVSLMLQLFQNTILMIAHGVEGYMQAFVEKHWILSIIINTISHFLSGSRFLSTYCELTT